MKLIQRLKKNLSFRRDRRTTMTQKSNNCSRVLDVTESVSSSDSDDCQQQHQPYCYQSSSIVQFRAEPPAVHTYLAATTLASHDELYYSREQVQQFQAARAHAVAAISTAAASPSSIVSSLEHLYHNTHQARDIFGVASSTSTRGYESDLLRPLQRDREERIRQVLLLAKSSISASSEFCYYQRDEEMLRSVSRIHSEPARRLAQHLGRGDAMIAAKLWDAV